MPRLSPLQTSFAGGELSPRLRGRVDSEVYHRGLAKCENFQALPQGPLLMRAGSRYMGEEVTASRLLTFRLSGESEDFVLALGGGKLHAYSRAGRVSAVGPELVVNGTFDVSLAAPWQIISGTWATLGFVYTNNYPVTSQLRQAIAVAPGSYQFKFYAVQNYNTYGSTLRVRLGTTAGGGELYDRTLSAAGETVGVDTTVVIPPGVGTVYFDALSNLSRFCKMDDISLRAIAGGAVELNIPWTDAQLRELQFVQEPAKDRAFFAHPNVETQYLSFVAPSTWTLATIPWVNKPVEWAGTNWPGVVELFQGRLVLGATPAQPHDIWGSKSGSLFDFGAGAPAVASDAYHYTLSTKGKLRWLQGQKVLLAGNETVESSIVGADQVITPVSPPDVRDESAFGSASIQGLHNGDQVLFVARDRKLVRAMNYSNEENGWISRAITFLAEHVTAGGIRELHFARSPVPTVFIVLDTGTVAACTYDRGEQVIAWWRADFSAFIHSIAVADGPDGSELWIAPNRAGGYYIERLPLHENGAVYVDSAATGVVAADGTMAGLAHLEGETVKIVVRGAVWPDQVVAAGQVQAVTAQDIVDDPTLVGAAVIVGLPYLARAVTLPLEGREAPQGAKRRFAKVGLLLSDSALPLVNGDRASPDRTPATPQDTGEPRTTGKVRLVTLGWDDEGKITIEQDLPLRTEVLGIYGIASMNEA